MNLVLWLHLLAAVTWIGGMLFLSLVLVPVFKREGFQGERRELFLGVALRFRKVVWMSILTMLVTGVLLLAAHVSSVTHIQTWHMVLKLKLVLVVFLIGITAAHDFLIGPWVARIQKENSAGQPAAQHILVTLSPWIARFGLVLALVILFLGIMLARV